MLTDLRGKHGHTILFLKTNICSACMNVRLCRMISSPFFIDSFVPFFVDICIFSFIEIMIVISDFLQTLNPTTSGISSRAFIFIVLQEFWNYMEFNLLVIILHCMILQSSFWPALSWRNIARNFIMLNATEAVTSRCHIKRCSWKYCKIHRKTLVPEALF